MQQGSRVARSDRGGGGGSLPSGAAKGLLHQLHSQRLSMDLLLETTPRESRYSNNLVELMKREEVALAGGGGAATAKSLKELVAKVDELLYAETRAFFAKSTQHNIKRWKSLADKLDNERLRIRAENNLVSDSGGGSDGSSSSKWRGNSATGGGSSPSHKIDLDLESRRLEEDYSRNWGKYEDFHLKEAFKGQAARVDAEWSTHEQELLEDYYTRKAGLLGESVEAVRHFHQSSSELDSAVRWQHNEKQKTLVHTAPVMSPVRKDSTKTYPSSSSLRKGPKGSAQEIERLEQQFKSASESLEQQKFGAKRWMARQEVRLLAQASEICKERQCIAELIAKEASDLELLL